LLLPIPIHELGVLDSRRKRAAGVSLQNQTRIGMLARFTALASRQNMANVRRRELHIVLANLLLFITNQHV
jgi:hypothetical protein